MKNKNLLGLTTGVLMFGMGLTSQAQTYCTPGYGDCTDGDEITNVTFAGINNNSTCSADYGYSDFTSISASVVPGNPYLLSVTIPEHIDDEAAAVWIDFNQNGIFDASEFFDLGFSPEEGSTLTLNITIPLTATLGATRMRVKAQYYEAILADEACDEPYIEYGEIEDYSVIITSGIPCTGTPSTGTVTSSVAAACGSTPIVLNTDITPEDGFTYQWQNSTDGGTTWNNLGTAQIAPSYTTTQTQASQYRLIVTCTNSALSDTSAAVSVTQNAPATCFCVPTLDCTDNDVITNVTFGTINNTTTCGANGYGNYTTLPAVDVFTSQSYPISVTVGSGYTSESVSVWIDYNQNGAFEANEFTYIGTGSGSVVSNSIAIPTTAATGNTRMRVRVAAVGSALATPNLACDEDQGYGETEDYLVNIKTVIDSVTVSTQGGVPAEIATTTGTLQVVATVYPSTANQAVTWSITPETGTATISATGLVTAQTAGTVWAKAVSAEDITKFDSLLITIDNVVVTVDSVVVSTQGGVPAIIATPTGTLQVVAVVYPSTISQNVTWSIIPATGTATISATGLVTAQSAGTVWAKATSTVDVSKFDSLLITINNTVVNVDSVVVNTQGGVAAIITTPSGTLPLVATVYPSTVAQTVNWSIIPVTGTATISTAGVVTATGNGTVWAKAVSTADGTKSDSILVTITLQSFSIGDLYTAVDFNLFPNPTSDVVTLTTSKTHGTLQLQLMDLTGKVLTSRAIQNNELNSGIMVDLSALSSGMYFIKLQGKDVNISKTVIRR
jgi:hypothetical protein